MSWPTEAMSGLLASYEAVPYDGLTHSETHPSLLATVASLLGMKPAPVAECRVLEIGCAQGYNLIGMALQLPGSEFVGIDFAPGQIETGRKAITELSLSNLSLHSVDLMEMDDSLGRFDYIIAHGFYSWVPQPVRDQLLALYRRLLQPNGVGYISYNTYPGGHFLNALRDGMLFHTARMEEPLERADEARRWIDLLAEAGEGQALPYGGFFRAYRQLLHDYREHLNDEAGRSNAGLLHDEMEEVNQPFYLREFAAHCQAAGLQYLGDTEFASMLASNLPASVATLIQRSARNRVEAEQYMDFARNRMFRRSLVCHQEVTLAGKPSMETIATLYLSSNAHRERVERPEGARPAAKFISPDGASLATDHPVTIAAFDYLGECWPRRIPFDEVVKNATRRVGRIGNPPKRREESGRIGNPPYGKDDQILAANLVKAYSTSPLLLELHRHAPALAVVPSERPLASRLARWQVRQNGRSVCNLLHKRVLLDEPDRYLLVRLDGSRTVEEISQELLGGPLQTGHWHLKKESLAETPELPLEKRVLELVRARLEWLALAALLEG